MIATPPIAGLARAAVIANPTLLDEFEALWRKAGLPVTWYPRDRFDHLILTVGEHARVDSELSRWFQGKDRMRRRRKPQYIHRITVPASWSPTMPHALSDGKLVLECDERPYSESHLSTVARYAVKYIVRVHGGQTVRLAQGTLKITKEKISIVESRTYS